MAIHKTRPRLGFRKKTVTDFAAFVQHVHTSLSGNIHFNIPAQELSELQSLSDTFRDAILQSAAKDTVKVAWRNSVREALDKKLKKIAGFIMNITSERDKLLTSGFEPVVTGAPLFMEPVSDLRAFVSGIPGVVNVLLRFRSAKPARIYAIETCIENPNEAAAVWSPIGTSSKTKWEITGLNPGTYSFRVISMGRRNNSVPSNFVTIAVA